MENHEYRYYVDAEKKIFRLHLEQDDMPWNPRTDMDGNIGTMFCMHRRYNLGDDTPYKDEDDLKRAIIRELDIPMKKIQSYAKTGKANVDLKYNRSDRQWEIRGMYYFLGKRREGLICCANDLEALEDDLIDGITIKDLCAISGNRLVVLPLYLYDHSGLTMSTSDFGDRWDSGQVGIIWTTIEKVKETRPGKRNAKEWRQLAEEDLKAEVKLYDMYLRGEVYGYIEEELKDSGEWETTDSCWGYYTDSVDPLEELADEVWGKGNHTDKIQKAA